VEQAPLLAVIVLLGAVVLTLGVLVYLAARRQPGDSLFETLAPENAQSPASSQPESPREAFPAVRLRKLEKQLADDRVLRNAVVREALGRGEHMLVARWVRELGDFLLDDLRGDGTLARPLAAVAVEVTRAADPASRAAALQELEGRTLASRLLRGGDASSFAFLEGVREEAFITALKGISPGAQEVALRLAPAPLRAAALREMPATQRQQIALAWVRRPDVSAQYALAAADELRARLADLHAGPADLDRALADLLDSLSREEQDALIDQLRREGDPRAFSGLITESALAHAPADLLGASALSVGPARLVTYLSGAEEGIRTDLLSACPPRLRREVEEELALRPGVSHEEFVAARRELLKHVREETVKRGLKPADVRAWRPRVVQTP
ncbi:MAG: hypothetical protein LC689_11480, partial [Myxococcales bacterium]|nr:hypothetical protein [Myxococcales bacterium]